MNNEYAIELDNFLSEPEFKQLNLILKRKNCFHDFSDKKSLLIDRVSISRFPRSFGNYTLLKVIDTGGMATVYLAEHIKTHKQVALKIVNLGLGSVRPNLELSKRFENEWNAIARIRHPNIIEVLDAGIVEGVPFYTMNYYQCDSLAKTIRTGPIPIDKATRIVQLIASGLQNVHNKGLIHRDINPNNIIDSETGPVLIDFGLAKDFQESSTRYTKTGAMMGTVCFMSPEQIYDAKNATIQSDIFSLGGVLYNSITGTPPFGKHDAQGTILDVLESKPIPPAIINPEIPPDLNFICLKCLEKNPEDRYTDAVSLAEDLERFLNGIPIAAKRPNVIKKSYYFCKRNKAACASAILFLFTLFVSGLYTAEKFRQIREQQILTQIKTTSISELAYLHTKHPISQEKIVHDFQLATHEKDKLKLAMVLTGYHEEVDRFLVSYVLDCSLAELVILLDEKRKRTWITNKEFFWDIAKDRQKTTAQRIRAMAVLAQVDSDNASWKDVQSDLAEFLLSCNLVEGKVWSKLFNKALLSCSHRFVLDTYDDRKDGGVNIQIVVLSNLVKHDPTITSRLIPNVSPTQFRFLSKHLFHNKKTTEKQLNKKISSIKRKKYYNRTDKDRSQLANCYLSLIVFCQIDPVIVFNNIDDPTTEILVATRCNQYQIGLEALIRSLESTTVKDEKQLRLLIVACAYYRTQSITLELRNRLRIRTTKIMESTVDSGVHHTAKWLLRKWNWETESNGKINLFSMQRNWVTTKSGYEMVKISQQYEYLLPEEMRHESTLNRGIIQHEGAFASYFIGCKEVTWNIYGPYTKEKGLPFPSQSKKDSPVLNRSFSEAAKFCNWLTLKEGFGQNEQCFQQVGENMVLVQDYQTKKGYRFATFYEHHNAIGESGFLVKNNHLYKFSEWFRENSNGQIQKVGRLQPNFFGLFDICGNATEWSCGNGLNGEQQARTTNFATNGYTLRGLVSMVFPFRVGFRGNSSHNQLGLRLVRGIPTDNSAK